jgi:uncharacterized damage-inducible protein DinB
MTEAWLTGPVPGVPVVFMPAAHSFLQVKQEMPVLLAGLTIDQIWQTVGASTTIGFHAVHLAGATDRLLTYARGEQLSQAQVDAARAERDMRGLDAAALIAHVGDAMDHAIAQLRATPERSHQEPREVGRQRLPSTVLGLIMHAGEHATRHAGQIATLRKVVAG